MSDCKHLRVGYFGNDRENLRCWCDICGFELLLNEWENKCETCGDFEEEE